jgi:N-acetyl-anhydromuramyl-L-alanine amidase AmpD
MARKRKSTDYIAVHAADTYARMDIGLEEIDQWHRAKGWSGCGYHYVIRRDGTVETGRELYSMGAHVKGYNHNSIGICLVGGKANDGGPEDNFTIGQYEALHALLLQLEGLFSGVLLFGHRNFPKVKKACPCFNVREWRASLN